VQLGAARQQAAQRLRVQVIVFGHAPGVGVVAGLFEDRLILLRQRVVLFEVDEGVEHRAAFPPAGRVIVRRDLVEAELLVVVRTDPLAGVERALLESRIDVAARDLLRHAPELLQDLAGPAADAHLQALEIVDRVDLLAVPATHLTAGLRREQALDVVLLIELVHHDIAAALRPPGLVDAGVRAERDRRAEAEGRILAEIVVGRGVTDFDRAVLHGVDDRETRHDFAGGENLDLELVVGRLGDSLGHHLGRAVQRVQRLRPAAGHAPLDRRRRLRVCRRGDRCARGRSKTGRL
jgi:hypothetical protein